MKYTRDIRQVARDYGVAVAYDEFITMLNPKNRGPAFRWENFPARAAKMAQVTVYQAFSDEEWACFRRQIQEEAEKSAWDTSEMCLQKSGILDWFTSSDYGPGAAESR